MIAPTPEVALSGHVSKNDGADRFLFRLAYSARALFGGILFVNGLNWWWKILPYPSMHDQANHALPHGPPFVQAMLNTGFMFDFVRIVEIAAGAGLLIDCWTPFLLVLVFPLSVGIWALRSHAGSNGGSRAFLAWERSAVAEMKVAVIVFGIIANLLGVTAAIWLGLLIVQGFTGR